MGGDLKSSYFKNKYANPAYLIKLLENDLGEEANLTPWITWTIRWWDRHKNENFIVM